VIESLNSDTPDGRMRRARLAEYYETTRWEYECADIELGFNYGDSPAIVPDGTAAPRRDPTGHAYVQVARPGHRVPHAWLKRDREPSSSSPVSTHAIIRAGAFLLLVGADGQEWLNAAAELVTRREIAIDGYRVAPHGDLLDVEGAWAELRGHDDGGAVLVRPDGHVAMRALTAPQNPVQALNDAIDVALGRPAGVESSAVR
jgi:2,4-dichlorophenol 6-monooxygenase